MRLVVVVGVGGRAGVGAFDRLSSGRLEMCGVEHLGRQRHLGWHRDGAWFGLGRHVGSEEDVRLHALGDQRTMRETARELPAAREHELDHQREHDGLVESISGMIAVARGSTTRVSLMV